jgi:hypothetical protein
MSADYHTDSNNDHGWKLRTRWRAAGNYPDTWHEREYPLLGPARNQGRQLACLNGVLAIELLRADSGEQVCSYQRSNNFWRDHWSVIRDWEIAIDRQDMAGYLLNRYDGSISDEQRRIVLVAVAIGGGTAYDRQHRICQQLVAEGLLARAATCWQLTDHGRAWLAD